MIKRRKHTVPNLNMASMPDLIFTVLFFFMIASHMRNSSPLVGLQTPTGTQLTQPDRKSALVYLYVGRDSKQVQVWAERHSSSHSGGTPEAVFRGSSADDSVPEGRPSDSHVVDFRCEAGIA